MGVLDMWTFLTIVSSVFIIAFAVPECLESYWKYRKPKDRLK